MKCPKCASSHLKQILVKGPDINVDRCPDCKGIWFDGGELEAILGVAAKELSVPLRAKKCGPLCPRCIEPLRTFQYPQTLVNVDMCKKCNGLWFDASELKEIKAVRSKLKQRGKLENKAPVTGAKGGLLSFIQTAMSQLSDL